MRKFLYVVWFFVTGMFIGGLLTQMNREPCPPEPPEANHAQDWCDEIRYQLDECQQTARRCFQRDGACELKLEMCELSAEKADRVWLHFTGSETSYPITDIELDTSCD